MRSFGLPSEEMGKLLLERAKVVLHPGRQFGPSGEGFMRLNFATSWDILSEALGRMEVVLCDLWNERDNWRRGEGT
jgi:bifunctional pyridoxal-dependent enzyme with beta-cystathionase and maltose regulon repressor activities